MGTASGSTAAPRIEVLWWRGCPSTREALRELREAMAELRLDGAPVLTREIVSDEQAGRERFVGSPTIRIDGRDVQAPGPSEPNALACRVYRLPDGRISPTPGIDLLRAALQAALGDGGSHGR